MNETADRTPQDRAGSASGDGLQRVGAALRAAREKKKLSIEEVGERLRLTPSTLTAIEAGQLDALPAMTFIRGYVRSYARLLGLDGEQLLGMLGEATAPISSRSVSQPFRATRKTRTPGRRKKWLGKAVLAVGLAAALVAGYDVVGRFFQSSGTAEPETPQLQLPDLAPEEGAAPAGSLEAIVTSPEDEVPEAPIVEEAGLGLPDDEEALVSEPVSDAVLTIVCRKESWIEVSVAGSKQLSGTVRAGETRSVTGRPPFDILIGNAGGVSVQYNGVDIDLAPFTRDRIARFTLGE
jgi:cytoskeleton protein RodZ